MRIKYAGQCGEDLLTMESSNKFQDKFYVESSVFGLYLDLVAYSRWIWSWVTRPERIGIATLSLVCNTIQFFNCIYTPVCENEYKMLQKVMAYKYFLQIWKSFSSLGKCESSNREQAMRNMGVVWECVGFPRGYCQ